MLNDHYTLLLEAAQTLRDLAGRAPDIGNELRRFADDLEELATRPGDPD
jgi:hypothetical protein